MRVTDDVVMITGGASGIGAAMAGAFAREGAAAVVLADIDAAAARATAARLPVQARGIELDVTDAAAVAAAVDVTEREVGPIGLCCSNAGIFAGRDLGTADDWERSWRVHVVAHVNVASAVLPRMAERGAGHLLVTASAAGLLTNTDSAPYSVTKHAAVALAEWLAIRHGDEGIGVSCLCPQGVNTPMTARPGRDVSATAAAGGFIEPEQVADAVLDALAEERFLILPHPEVAEYERRRAGDRDRWLRGMRKVRARLRAGS